MNILHTSLNSEKPAITSLMKSADFSQFVVALAQGQVLAVLKEDGAWTQMLFLLTGDIRLEGATPLEKLQKGEIEPVVLAAKCYGSHSAA